MLKKNPKRRFFSQSLGSENFLKVLKNSQLIIGNSSSGIIEAPSFKIPTINIGERQDGRIKAASIIDCYSEKEHIIKGVKKALSSSFKKKCKKIKNPYGDGKSSTRILKILKNLKYPLEIKKDFYEKWKNEN